MSVLVVQDVTAYQQGSRPGNKKVSKAKSTITPFEKVLETEEKKPAVASGKKAARVKKTTRSSGQGSTGKTSLQSVFERAAEKYNISYDFLVAVAKAESDFNAKCVSSAGAKGIMQLMPYECEEFGVTNPYDEEQNIMAAAKLLKAHLKKFDGDYILAAAAYNAGSGAVQKYGGVPPYQETQNYVKKIKKFMKEGVTVPDRQVKTSERNASEGEGGATSVSSTKHAGKTDSKSAAGADSSSGKAGFDTGKDATEEDLEQVTVSVGTGEDTVTMTYGAYLKYLELGSMGVG